jgi:hypothetical protein
MGPWPSVRILTQRTHLEVKVLAWTAREGAKLTMTTPSRVAPRRTPDEVNPQVVHRATGQLSCRDSMLSFSGWF